MRHINSFQNIKDENKNQIGNLESINAFSLRLKDFKTTTPKNYNSNLSLQKKSKNHFPNKKENINKEKKNNNEEKRNYKLSNYSPSPEKKKHQINIKLNINNEIIANNYSEKKNENKKCIYEELIKDKKSLIYSLEKELSEIKDQINKIEKKKNIKNSLDRFDKKGKNKSQLSEQNLKQNKKIKREKKNSKNVKQFFQNLIFNTSNSKSTSKKNSSKNIFTSKNLILNTSNNYNYYIKANKNKNKNNNILYHESTKEIEIDLDKKHSRKNSLSIIKSNSFLYTSNNINTSRKNDIYKRSKSQFQNSYFNFSQCNNNVLNNNNNNNSEHYENGNIFYQLEKIKDRTKYLLSSYLKLCKN